MQASSRVYLHSFLAWLAIAISLFAPAGTLDIGSFWIYLGICGAVLGYRAYSFNPELANERFRPGGTRLSPVYLLIPARLIVHWVIAGLDRGRFHWSDTVPMSVQIAALIIFALCWVVIIWAVRVNQFFSSIPRIQSDRNHHVITAGPYGWVRHPGYAAGIIATLVSGIALGSWFAAVAGAIGVPFLLRRARNEDMLLRAQLFGYAEYAHRVRYRIMPYVW